MSADKPKDPTQKGKEVAKKKKDPIYRVYHVEGGNLVQSTKEQIYNHPHDEALYKITDIHLVSYEWDQTDFVNNRTPFHGTLKMESLVGSRVTSGEEWVQKLNIKAEFPVLKVTAGAEVGFEHKSFSEEETSKQVKRTVSIEFGADKPVYLFTKVYHYKIHVWFQLDAWNKLWTVGQPGKDKVLEALSTFDVAATETTFEIEDIRGTHPITIKTVDRAAEQKNIKRLEDCTRACQNYIRDQGLVGDWTPPPLVSREGMPK